MLIASRCHQNNYQHPKIELVHILECVISIQFRIPSHATLSQENRPRGKPMKIVAAPNAFKGSMSVTEAAEALAEGITHFLITHTINSIHL